MKNLILAAPLAVVAALVQIQPVAACVLSNDLMDSHSVLMSAAMLIFALAATVTAFTRQPAARDGESTDGRADRSQPASLPQRLGLLTRS